MDMGSFFETICLGAGADGTQTTSLPLLQSGKKSSDHLRIEKQAQRFLDMFDPTHPDWCGKTITDKQVVLTHQGRKGTIDFITDPLIVYDLKLTATIQDGYWSDLSKVDFIQQVHYEWLYEMNYGVRPEMRLIIFDYSPKMLVKEVKLNITDEAREMYHIRFDEAEEQLGDWSLLEEFPRRPNEKDCSRCPLICTKRMIKENIIYEEYEI
jgi:hypothetical protein